MLRRRSPSFQLCSVWCHEKFARTERWRIVEGQRFVDCRFGLPFRPFEPLGASSALAVCSSMARPSPASDAIDGSSASSSVDAHATLLRAYLWIVHAQMSGFIADSLWQRLPEAWHAPLLALSDEECTRLPTDLPLPQHWPQDLAHLVQSGRAASAVVAPVTPPVAAAEVSPCLLCHTKNVRNMGPKKQHEVLRLAPLIASVARRCGASAVVDVGSGMGCAPSPQTLTPLAMAPHALSPRTLTLHPTPYTLHSTPDTLHPTPDTLHPTPYTLHPTPTPLPPQPAQTCPTCSPSTTA